MQNLSDESISEVKFVNFGSVAVDTVIEKYVLIQNISDVSRILTEKLT